MGHNRTDRGWTYHPYEAALVGAGADAPEVTRRLAEALGLDLTLVPPRAPGSEGFLDGLDLLVHDGVLVVPSGPTALPSIDAGDEVRAATDLREHWNQVTARRPVYGLVLAGGRSTRMGTDKAALAYGDDDEVHRVYGLLEAVCARVFVSCRQDQADLPGRRGLPQIHDRYLDLGPASGLLSAFDAHPGASWLVVACDLPRVDAGVIHQLLAQRNPFRVATAFRGHQDLPEPLCAVYEPKARARLFQFLAAGSDCPRKMLLHSPATILPAPGDRLTNVNTPEDFQEVLRGLGR